MIKRIGALVFALTLLFAFAVPASADNPFGVPVGYTSYEYIESDGSVFIDLDYRPNERTGFYIDFQLLTNKTQNSILGSQANATGSNYTFAVIPTSEYEFALLVGGTLTQLNVSDAYSRHTLEVDGNVSQGTSSLFGTYTLDGVSGQYSTKAFQSVNPLYLFATNSGGTALNNSVIRLYDFDLLQGGEVDIDFVPVSNELGVFGLWDSTNDVFYGVQGSGTITAGPSTGSGTLPEDSVADVITDLNTQIHDIESAIYDDLHTYSAQVDPSTATNFSGNFLSAMSFISNTWTSAYNQLGDMQVIVTFPLFLAIAMLFIGRMNSVIASGAMKSKKNNDKKGGGDVG